MQKKVGDFLMNELKKIPEIKEVRGRGLTIGLDFEQPIKEIRTRLLFEKESIYRCGRNKYNSVITLPL